MSAPLVGAYLAAVVCGRQFVCAIQQLYISVAFVYTGRGVFFFPCCVVVPTLPAIITVIFSCFRQGGGASSTTPRLLSICRRRRLPCRVYYTALVKFPLPFDALCCLSTTHELR